MIRQSREKGRHLYLMRHGAAVQDGRQISDFNRPLSPHGVQETVRMIELFHQKKVPVPDCILCSTALRTRQTAELVRQLFCDTPVLYREALYLAPAFRLMETLRTLDDIFGTVMVIGHHPGLEQTIAYLAEPKEVPVLQPSNCVGIDLPFENDWHSLAPGFGTLSFFWEPGTLK